ncbi:ATP synthase F1 subunit delta [Leadbettera azotonutricia]|uniref:ATP synthase subunit delta n=1 Tax=Leadbettera azotonutricia (strain ATCC BAA-888 / DSM 13862 / ZAS-9) TaxID=545695 RepID=F5YCF9_LEAAZ|nr:ATP synthase F1 subunit delta [Leadbettera azotonutricia]AEF83366.1 ATP synthase F1, delta subunit [Leadbettera azotonutricia ZAS-9]
MFNPERWAAAFVNSLGPDSGEGLEALKAVSAWVKKLPGAVFGSFQAEKVNSLVLEAGAKTGGIHPALKMASRFVSLLIKRNMFRHIDSVIKEAEKLLDKERGVLRVFAESAFPLDGETEKRISEEVRHSTGAKEIRLEKSINPGLIGGYRLRIGDEIIDASIRLQLKLMANDLAAGGS